ncbi:hypothetical protein COB55_01370 [Candidatus Wolfebacteria bacterium]|nr:MAG: hypothetical protein COB55_01370 [Candidatus Wolfebacteria bacterium]
MEKKQHTVGSNNIFVEETIPDEEKYSHPLVLVHGSFGGYSMWNMIVEQLSMAGFHTYALSLRGHKPSGDVDLGTVGMNEYVDDIKTVTTELKLEKPVVIGHSMAGLLVLMYSKKNPTAAVIPIDPSTSHEVQGTTDEDIVQRIPLVYNAMEAGMPTDPAEIMKVLPDISRDVLMQMKDMLGTESGLARRDRKRGISITKEEVHSPILMFGAELGKSVPFGISLESTQKMGEYYGAEVIEIKGATHPGMLMGEHSGEVATGITSWLNKNNG